MGFLVPPWYKGKETSKAGLLAAAFFASTKAGRQSYRSWRRNHRVNAYIMMLWAVISMCVVAAICSWMFLLGKIDPSFWDFFLMRPVSDADPGQPTVPHSLQLGEGAAVKLSLLIAVGIISVSVFVIWVPARLQISPKWIGINNIWDRIEKSIFAVIDLARSGVDGGGGRGGQRRELNMDIMNRPKEEEGLTSGMQGDAERWQARWGSHGRDM